MEMYTHIGNYRVVLKEHAITRAIERFKKLHIAFDSDEEYVDLAVYGVAEVLNNKYMQKYLDNLLSHTKRRDTDILVYDKPNRMVYALVVKSSSKIVVKTLGTEAEDEWMYSNNTKQRLCWIHNNAFVFSTSNNNVSWNW